MTALNYQPKSAPDAPVEAEATPPPAPEAAITVTGPLSDVYAKALLALYPQYQLSQETQAIDAAQSATLYKLAAQTALDQKPHWAYVTDAEQIEHTPLPVVFDQVQKTLAETPSDQMLVAIEAGAKISPRLAAFSQALEELGVQVCFRRSTALLNLAPRSSA